MKSGPQESFTPFLFWGSRGPSWKKINKMMDLRKKRQENWMDLFAA